mmetsp:Transcript_17616/g.14293  ORF Transcript_17616/g.14293 Transcript_17616/m.14293 type:complete len:88 (-) Transcript_17616:77-340(-)
MQKQANIEMDEEGSMPARSANDRERDAIVHYYAIAWHYPSDSGSSGWIEEQVLETEQQVCKGMLLAQEVGAAFCNSPSSKGNRDNDN